MKYTFLTILAVTSLGIPAYAIQAQKEDIRIETSIETAPYCSDRTNKTWTHRKKGVIVKMKPFVVSSTFNQN